MGVSGAQSVLLAWHQSTATTQYTVGYDSHQPACTPNPNSTHGRPRAAAPQKNPHGRQQHYGQQQLTNTLKAPPDLDTCKAATQAGQTNPKTPNLKNQTGHTNKLIIKGYSRTTSSKHMQASTQGVHQHALLQ